MLTSSKGGVNEQPFGNDVLGMFPDGTSHSQISGTSNSFKTSLPAGLHPVLPTAYDVTRSM